MPTLLCHETVGQSLVASKNTACIDVLFVLHMLDFVYVFLMLLYVHVMFLES